MQKPSGPPSMFLGGKPVEMLGKLYYRTADGKIIEMPSDMTKEQVIKLEADARAAITRIGKGPPPQPVPDVRKLDKKTDKKTQLKAFSKGKKFGAAGKGRGKPQGRSSPSLAGAGSRKVAQYLASKAAPIVAKGFARLQQLREGQQTHDEAEEKRVQAEKAVLIPASEGQSKSNAGQVNVVGDRPAPKVDANKGKQTLQATLRENVPKKIEDVDNFKRDQRAQHTGAEVLKTMQTDKNAVVSTFQDMGHTPPPAPREHEPEALPPTEIAPPTGALALGKDGIAPLQKEHTDLSNFTNEADKKLNEEGVTQEQLNMVDSGDLATANKEKKGMEKTAKEEPVAVQKFAQQQGQNVEQDLKQEETKKRGELNAKRKAGLSATKAKQQGAKSALEKKRDEVAAKINGIYTTAQEKVKKRLADLEIESMKRFDDGNAKASKEFEDTVNREIDAFKDDRYSGMFGWARKVRDWIKGIDDLPPVKAIFDRNKEKFVAAISKLVEDISADNKRVIQECKDELQKARTKIAEYVDGLGPSLKDIGKKTADEMSSKLDEMDKFVAKREEELQNKLKDKQTAAIKAIDEKIEKMKESMSGALAKLGKLLLLAAKKFFTWALEKVGFSLSDIEGIINKGAAVLKAIFTQPIQFVKNLMNAAITGFQNFGKNFLKHLKDALFEWLTGSLEGLVLPQTWDFPGIISVALQMIGISYQNIRKHMVDVMGEPVVAGLEKTFELVKTLITKGPMAAWDQLKEMAAQMRDAFIEAVKDFIKQKIIEQAIQWLVSLFIPGAGIIKAIIGIYDTVVFFIKKAKQIMEMISNFLGSISEIAAGNIGAAADAMEKGLARGLSLVINFLAALLRLSGITNKIRDAIQKIRGKVDSVLAKVAKWIADKAKALGSFVVQAGVPKDPNERLRLAAKAAVSIARRLTGKITQPVLNAAIQAIKLRYGLRELEAFDRGGFWWVKATINPSLEQNLGLPLNPVDVSQSTGVLDLYRGIHYEDKTFDYAQLTPQQLAEQLIKEEDFSPAVYTILKIDRAQAPTVTLAQRQAAAQTVANEIQDARSASNVRAWWKTTPRPNLFLAMLQRFINRRTVFQQELKERRIKQLSGFTFTNIPFISTTKRPERAAQYAIGTVKATNVAPSALPSTAGKVVGKVFVYLFDGNDLVQLKAADIRYMVGQGQIAGHARYSKADKEITFTGSIPPANRIGEVIARDSDSVGKVAVEAREKAKSQASSRGGLLPWSES